jgi:hypothetical protein
MTVELPREPIHSPFGGSVAARVLHCPASADLIQRVPAYLRKVSAYADKGTALHSAINSLLAENIHARVESLAGKTFGDYTVTSDDVEDSLRPAYAFAETLLDVPGAEYFLEQRVVFPTIANTFGTADLIIRINSTIHVVDFKFGAGVRVQALTPDGDEDVINAQLLFYACSARHSLPAFFANVENIVLTIVQPMSIDLDAEMVSSVTVTHAELDEFIAAYRAACEEALSGAPHLEPGPWCRFCPARLICPEHTKPLLNLAAFTLPRAAAVPREAYLRLLAEGLNLADAVRDIYAALRDQAKRALENGENVPGYALSAGRAERRWRDENAARAALQNLGLDHDDVAKTEMRSPKQVEIRAKARGLKVPPELIVSARSGVSLVKAENVRVPILGRAELARMFSEALKAFQGGRQA